MEDNKYYGSLKEFFPNALYHTKKIRVRRSDLGHLSIFNDRIEFLYKKIWESDDERKLVFNIDAIKNFELYRFFNRIIINLKNEKSYLFSVSTKVRKVYQTVPKDNKMIFEILNKIQLDF